MYEVNSSRPTKEEKEPCESNKNVLLVLTL